MAFERDSLGRPWRSGLAVSVRVALGIWLPAIQPLNPDPHGWHYLGEAGDFALAVPSRRLEKRA